MDLGLKGKIAIVAGASKGLGKAVALGLSAEGAKVAIVSRNQRNLDAARHEIEGDTSGEVLTVRADLTDQEDIKRLVQETLEQFGRVDILVNNAGGPPAGFFWEMDDDKWQKGVELTLMSSVRLTREVLHGMRQQKWGRIINITSVSVKQPINELLLSNSLRLSVVGWAKTLAAQVAPDGVLINNVCPGWTRTDRVEELIQGRAKAANKSPEEIEESILKDIPIKRMGKPEELASLIAFLASERASYITGASIQVDGGSVKGIF